MEWPLLTLKQAGVSLIDCVHATPSPVTSGYPYIAIPQMTGGRISFEDARHISDVDYVSWTKKAQPKKYDVVLSRRTNPGVVAPVQDRTQFALGQNLVLLRADGSNVAPEFLRWLTTSPQWWSQIEKFMNVGAIFNSLKCADVPKFQLPIPPLLEQKAIAVTLTALDDKIELNRRMNETLEASARALFRDWFVDFGPTRAKAEGRLAYLAPDLWSLFPNSFNEDGTPEGWGWSALSDVLVLQRGFDLPKDTRTDGRFPVIAASGPSGTHNEMRVAGPGVCTGRSGFLGGVFYVNQDFWPLNTSLWVKEYPNATPLYAYHALLDMDLASFNAGSAVPTLNRNHVHGMPVVKPPMDVIRSFDTTAARLYAIREANLQENAILAQTRDALLPKLMSGAIRVREAESAVAALC